MARLPACVNRRAAATPAEPASSRRPRRSLVAAIAPGYQFEGPALELGGLMLDADRPDRRAHQDPARHAQPARPGRRGHRHRQDQDPAAAGRAAQRRRRPGLRGRHQGRPLRAQRARGERTTRSPPARPSVGQQWTATGFPVEFYALGGQGIGIPLRVTMSAFGPTLLAKVLGPQRHPGVLASGWSSTTADRAGLPLLDLADLRAVAAVPHLRRGQGRPEGARRPVQPPPPG